MKIFSVPQLKLWDKRTINQNQVDNSAKVSSAVLIERAASGVVDWLLNKFSSTKDELTFHFFCGPGNNGADGLLSANILLQKGLKAKVWIFKESGSVDYNRELANHKLENIYHLKNKNDSLKTLSELAEPDNIIIDSIFGNGLNKKLSGIFAETIYYLNDLAGFKVAIDMPSGLFADDETIGKAIFKADTVLTFEKPKLSFFVEDSQKFIKSWNIIKIGLSKHFEEDLSSDNHYLTKNEIAKLKIPRNKISHKNTYGHVLLVGGTKDKFGCIALAAKAALRSGCGLVSVDCPLEVGAKVISMIPEVMAEQVFHYTNNNKDDDDDKTDYSRWTDKNYHAIAIGPGLEINLLAKERLFALLNVLNMTDIPILIDADGLNLIARYPELKSMLGRNCILTPHPKEFSRLAGRSFDNGWDELKAAQDFAITHKLVLVLKKSVSMIFTPEGKIYISERGTHGMATAGSGDVLTGMITSFLGQGYTQLDAALLAVYLHGLAGEIGVNIFCAESLMASDIIDNISAAFGMLS
ncbi:MAG: NAD(P)H-hydrate dehydratase [SAR324 cluster bacterium]|nr:NAD(P)H-hydrate dehydratase [SAR324 cluster bacterium]